MHEHVAAAYRALIQGAAVVAGTSGGCTDADHAGIGVHIAEARAELTACAYDMPGQPGPNRLLGYTLAGFYECSSLRSNELRSDARNRRSATVLPSRLF